MRNIDVATARTPKSYKYLSQLRGSVWNFAHSTPNYLLVGSMLRGTKRLRSTIRQWNCSRRKTAVSLSNLFIKLSREIKLNVKQSQLYTRRSRSLPECIWNAIKTISIESSIQINVFLALFSASPPPRWLSTARGGILKIIYIVIIVIINTTKIMALLAEATTQKLSIRILFNFRLETSSCSARYTFAVQYTYLI